MGGGAFEAGLAVTAAQWTAASAGDVENDVAFDFGTADEAVGTVGWWSFIDANGEVGYGTLPSTVIADGDSFEIDANSLDFNGSST